MDNFSVYLSLYPNECKIENNKILINKRLINPLNLRNYYVAINDFATALSTKTKNITYIVIKGLPELFHGLVLDGIESVNIPVNFNEENEYDINDRINNYLRAYAYVLIELLYQRSKKITYKSNANKIFIISNTVHTDEKIIVVCTPNSELEYTLTTPTDHHSEYKNITSEFKGIEPILEVSQQSIDSPDNRLIDENFTELSNHYERWAERYDKLKHSGIILSQIKFHLVDMNLILKYTDKRIQFYYNHKNYEIDAHLYEGKFILNVPVSYKILQNNSIIIETDLTQPQYFNNKTCNIIKVLNYGENVYQSNITNYYKVVKSYITTINITISLLNNNINITELLKDYIFINLHFKQKNELE